MTIHEIVNGDSRQMNDLADKSVHLIVTSPPYWELKGIINNVIEYDTTK
ncbi:MAG: hypothetical protein LBD45_06490 [Bacteroidales bacterium]|jgi:site-specific DNA-methyltransferase (adenine-specific)|nr:hypothetical protein [Bacteroidales bacterium]